MKNTKKKTTKQKTAKTKPKVKHSLTLGVVELFAGVGGFRIGLKEASKRSKIKYNIVWSNQWEPATKTQHASDIYTARFGEENHSNENIEQVIEEDFEQIPDHDLLVGGFPCQDYSVARTLGHASGLIGRKGVLWWSIHNIIMNKAPKRRPNYLMLENVDRLLKSPAAQRGRDFAIMLASLANLDYIVEWRVINAADYGMPQRRRRVFIMGYKKGSPIFKKIEKMKDPVKWVLKDGVMSSAFPIESHVQPSVVEFSLDEDIVEISDKFESDSPKSSPFNNAGIMIDRRVYTIKGTAKYKGKFKLLKDILVDEKDVPDDFHILKKDIERWEYLKGAKKEERRSNSGHVYHYAEGSMVFPDSLDNASRTIVTGEGGNTPSRFKHVIKTKSGKLRRLMPIELERLNMFPDGHTEGATDTKRAFFMGNALVVGVVKKLGIALIKQITN